MLTTGQKLVVKTHGYLPMRYGKEIAVEVLEPSFEPGYGVNFPLAVVEKTGDLVVLFVTSDDGFIEPLSDNRGVATRPGYLRSYHSW